MTRMNCEMYKDLVAAHVDDVLSSDEHRDVEEHLGACQECQLLFSQQQEFQEAFQAKILAKAFILPVPAAVEQRLHTALAEETSVTDQGSPSPWQQTKDWFQTPSFFPRFAFGLAIASLLLVLVVSQLPKLFSTGQTPVAPVAQVAEVSDPVEPAASIVTQAVESYQELTETQPPLAYAIQEPAALKTAFNRSGELDFFTHVLDFRQAGLQLRGGTIRHVENQPIATSIYDGDQEHIVCLRQHGQIPSELAGGAWIQGGYLYTSTDHSVFISQHANHFCSLVSRLPRQEFLSRIATLQ